MDKLTLKEIAPYLPYKLHFIAKDREWELNKIDIISTYKVWACSSWNKKKLIYEPEINCIDGCIGHGFRLSEVKILLYPLSQLTQEIEHNGERFVPMVELFKLKTQVTGSEIFDYFIENDTAILRLKGHQFEEITFKTFFEIDLEPNQVAFSIVSEIWEDDQMKQENINQCGNEMLMYQKLHEWHFDLYGLLDRGLAIDKSTVKEVGV